MGDPAMTISQKQKADKLRSLHNGPDILLFANAWDVASACILERLEFPAIATTSAGIANTLGYADGQQITSVEMLRVVSHIAHAVNIPVTADMEAGYSTSAVQMHQVALQLIEAGAVGLNLEDGEDDEARVSEKYIDTLRTAPIDGMVFGDAGANSPHARHHSRKIRWRFTR